VDKLSTPKIVHLLDKNERIGSMHGYTFRGWDYEGGWLVVSPQLERYREKAIWVSSPTDFGAVPRSLIGHEVIDIGHDPIDLSDEEKDAIRRMIWHWEIWEASLRDGTCMVQSLAKALDLTIEAVREMFVQAFRDPRVAEEAVRTLEENGYKVCNCGPNGFGYRERRRLVTMTQTADPTKGHVVLIYENDENIFDSSGRFKKVSDLLAAGWWGYKLGDVLVFEKVELEDQDRV
jgi:hypothetical protein